MSKSKNKVKMRQRRMQTKSSSSRQESPEPETPEDQTVLQTERCPPLPEDQTLLQPEGCPPQPEDQTVLQQDVCPPPEDQTVLQQDACPPPPEDQTVLQQDVCPPPPEDQTVLQQDVCPSLPKDQTVLQKDMCPPPPEDQTVLQPEGCPPLPEDLRSEECPPLPEDRTDILTLRQTHHLEPDHENEIQSCTKRVSEDQLLVQNLRTKMEEELQAERQKNKIIEAELEKAKTAYECIFEQDSQIFVNGLLKRLKMQNHDLPDLESQELLLQEMRAEKKNLREKMWDQLQVKIDEKLRLQKELHSVTASREEDNEDEAHLVTLRQKIVQLQRELQDKIKTRADAEASDELLLQTLRNEHDIVRQKMMEQLRTVKEEKRILQKELDQERTSEEQRSRADVSTLRQQAEQLQSDIDKEKESNARYQLLARNLQAEQDVLHQKMVEQLRLVEKNAAEQETLLLSEMDHLKTQLILQLSLNLDLVMKLQPERGNDPAT